MICPCCGKPKKIEGLGTSLKPAMELIACARKPLSEKTVAANVLEHSCGALNIDACRISADENLNGGAYAKNATQRDQLWGSAAGNAWRRGGAGVYEQPEGRWPANVILEGDSLEVIECFAPEDRPAARFFYSPKASAAEREEGLEDYPLADRHGQYGNIQDGRNKAGTAYERGKRANVHPTVKPIDLMAWLIRLVTPPRGIVLDPFMGSGSTGIAAHRQGFRFIGIEKSPEYFEIAVRRLRAAYEKPDLFIKQPTPEKPHQGALQV